MTQPIKADPVTLLALGSRMGLQSFKSTPAPATPEPEKQRVASLKPSAVANGSRSDASTVMTLAKSARLQCVSDDAGAL